MNVTIDYLENYPHHIPALAQWMFEKWGFFYPRSSLETTTKWVTKTARKSGLPLTMIALDGPNLVGFVMLQKHELCPVKGLTPWLGGLLVKEDYKCKGIGKKLHQSAIDYVKHLPCKKLYLLTFDPALCDWYGDLGWTVLKTDKVDHHPITIMSVDL